MTKEQIGELRNDFLLFETVGNVEITANEGHSHVYVDIWPEAGLEEKIILSKCCKLQLKYGIRLDLRFLWPRGGDE